MRLSLRTRGDNHHAHIILLCALYKGARFSSKFRLAYFSLIARNSAGFSLCASVMLSSHCGTLRSALLYWSRLCSARLSALHVSDLHVSASAIVSASAFHSSRPTYKHLLLQNLLYLLVRSRSGLRGSTDFQIDLIASRTDFSSVVCTCTD